MLSREENELLTRVDAGTPMGALMRRYWIPALLSEEITEPDSPPVRVRLFGEVLVAFRDSSGRAGLLERIALTAVRHFFLAAMRPVVFAVSIMVGSSTWKEMFWQHRRNTG